MKKVIAFLARAGSGKTTASQYLIDNHDAVRVSFAGPLKELAKKLFNLSDGQVYGKYKEDPISGLYRLGQTVTPRMLMQALGANGREFIGARVWIDAALNSIRKAPGNLVVIDDCRYLNEAVFISQLEGDLRGHVIKIVSPDRQSSADPNHPSEAEVDLAGVELLSSVIVNRQCDGMETYLADVAAVVEPLLGRFPGRMRG